MQFHQRLYHKDITKGLTNEVINDPVLLQHIITGDKSWVYGYNIKTKASLEAHMWAKTKKSKCKCIISDGY